MFRIRQALEALKTGPMTSAEIADAIGVNRHLASQIMLKLIKKSQKCPQRAYIRQWVYDHQGQRKYPRAVYAIGARPNAPKPARDQLARKKEYEARKKSILKTSSVFRLAVSLKCLRYQSTPGKKTKSSAKNASISQKASAPTETMENTR